MARIHELLAEMYDPQPEIAEYGWIIDYANDFEGGVDRDEVGVMGPRNIAPAISVRLNAGEGTKFKMYDDDGEHYYTGRIIDTTAELANGGDHLCGEWALAPLDDWGTPNAGAVTLRRASTGEAI